MPRKSKGRSQEPSERDSLVSRPSTSSNSNMFASVSYATYSVENAVNLSTSIMRGFNDSTFHNNNQQQQRPHGPNRSQPNYFKNIISQNNNQKEKKTPPMAPSVLIHPKQIFIASLPILMLIFDYSHLKLETFPNLH